MILMFIAPHVELFGRKKMIFIHQQQAGGVLAAEQDVEQRGRQLQRTEKDG